MNETYDALFAAVCANPLDDEQRLILADYLERQGDHLRAEFIRVQVELATWGERDDRCYCSDNSPPDGCGWCRQTDTLRKRQRKLLDLLLDRGTFADIGRLTNPNGYLPCLIDVEIPAQTSVWHVFFRRGFAAIVACIADEWRRSGKVFAKLQPLELVRLTTWPHLELHPDYRRTRLHRLAGLNGRYWPAISGIDAHQLQVSCMLEEEYGVKFELPPSPRQTSEQSGI